MSNTNSITWTSGDHLEVTEYLIDNGPAISNMTSINTTPLNGYIGTTTPIDYNQTITLPYSDRTTMAGMTIHGDLTVNGKIKIPEGDIHRIELDKDDIIMLTFDIDKFDVQECSSILQMWQSNFPNHKVIGTIKGVKIDLIKDKSNKKEEASW